MPPGRDCATLFPDLCSDYESSAAATEEAHPRPAREPSDAATAAATHDPLPQQDVQTAATPARASDAEQPGSSATQGAGLREPPWFIHAFKSLQL